MYVDESGDTGLTNSPSRFFALSGLVLHELRWPTVLDEIIAFRRHLKAVYGLKLRDEVHASPMLNKPGPLASVPKHRRLLLLRDVLEFQASKLCGSISIINVIVDKGKQSATRDIFDFAWRALLTRFHNTIRHRNFAGPRNANDKGLLVADDGQQAKLRMLVRKARRYNPVASKINQGQVRQILTHTIVEDPVHRDSGHSLFVQLADVNAYFLLQMHQPNKYLRRQGAGKWLGKLNPVLCKAASPGHPLGIVVL